MKVNLRKLVLSLGTAILLLMSNTSNATGYVSWFYKNYIDTYKRDYSVRFYYKFPVLSQTAQSYRRRGAEKNGLNLSCGPTAVLLAKNHKDKLFTIESNKNEHFYRQSVNEAYAQIPSWLTNNLGRPTTTNHNTNARELEYIANSYGEFSSIETYNSRSRVETFRELDNVMSDNYMAILYLSRNASRSINQTGYTHAVIVYAINSRYVYYIDPWDGRRKRASRRAFQDSIHVASNPVMLYLK